MRLGDGAADDAGTDAVSGVGNEADGNHEGTWNPAFLCLLLLCSCLLRGK
jgi:hypothetical protein